MGLGKRTKEIISEINPLMCNSAADLFLPRWGSDQLLLTGLAGSSGSASTSLSCVYMEKISTRSTVLERRRKLLYVSRMRSWFSKRAELGGGR